MKLRRGRQCYASNSGTCNCTKSTFFSESCKVLLYDICIYIKTFKPLGWKPKLPHVQCIRRTNVLAYPWAKTEDNLVAKHANCGSQGSPLYKTSYQLYKIVKIQAIHYLKKKRLRGKYELITPDWNGRVELNRCASAAQKLPTSESVKFTWNVL